MDFKRIQSEKAEKSAAIERALAMIAEGATVYRAGKECGVNATTLYSRIVRTEAKAARMKAAGLCPHCGGPVNESGKTTTEISQWSQ